MVVLVIFVLFTWGIVVLNTSGKPTITKKEVIKSSESIGTRQYWFLLQIQSQQEKLYYGVPGNINESDLLKTFQVKSGIPGQRPTPLPQLFNRDYWLIISKQDSSQNPETAPYFLALDIPYSDTEPYGPVPYLECNGQCDWQLPGPFGLHGVNGNLKKISQSDPGSSGCIRHSDEDITYLYQLLNPETEEIRYYIKDS